MGEARPERRPLVWWLTGLTTAVMVAALVFVTLNADRMGAPRTALNAILAAAMLLYAGTGYLIASRRPGHAIGWLLGSIGLALAASVLAEQYALYGLATAPGEVPVPKLVGCASATTAAVTVALLCYIVLLFPDGRIPSPRWRPVLWSLGVVFAGWGSQEFQAGTTVTGGISNALVSAGVAYPNPVGFLPRHGWYSDLLKALFLLAVLTAIAVVASVFARRRGASPERRQQLAWLGYVGALTVVWILALGLGSVLLPGPAGDRIGTVIWAFLTLTPVVGIPLACVVAILRYRLYDLGRIVSRTVTYAVVTGLLVGVYAGLVLLISAFTGHGHTSPVTVAGSTLAAAALFTPLRARVQRAVDHRFNRARYDAERLVNAFAARLQDAVDADAIRDDLVGVVHAALAPEHVSVWSSPSHQAR